MTYLGAIRFPVRVVWRFFTGLPESAHVTVVLVRSFWLTYRLWKGLSAKLGPDPALNGKLMWETARNAWVPRLEEFAGLRIRVRGAEHFDPGRRYLVVSNHTSTLDILAAAKAVPWGMFVVKSEIVKNRFPVIAKAVSRCGQVIIDRSDTARAVQAINDGIRAFPQASPVFFAEGTRSIDGHMSRFKKGAFRTAIGNDLPVLPIVVSGTHRALPKGTLLGLKRFSDVLVECLPPVETETLGPDQVEYLRGLVRSRMVEAYYSNPLNPPKPESLG